MIRYSRAMLHAIKILQNADFGFLKLERNLKESHCHFFLATSRIKVPQDAQHKHRVCFCLGSQSPESTYKQGNSVETNPGSKTVMCCRFPVLTSIRGHGCLINIDVRWAMQIRSSAQTRSKAPRFDISQTRYFKPRSSQRQQQKRYGIL